MSRLGMDADAVEAAGRDLGRLATDLQRAVHDIDRLVRSLPGVWLGTAATRYVQEWELGCRRHALSAADSVAGLGKTALANAADQRRVSGTLDGGGGAFWPTDPGLTLGGGSGQGQGNPDPGDLGNYQDLEGPLDLSDSEVTGRDIRQGQIGDCWLLAGLGSVATANPAWIRDHLRRNPDGSYTVTLFEKHDPWFGDTTYEAREITVPASVVEKGARDAQGEPNYASIYEKAAAVFAGGSYEDIDGGYESVALEMVTGRSASVHNDQSLESIRDGLADGRIYAVGSERGDTWWPFDDEVDDKGIVPQHAYMIDKVEERDGTMKIHLLNPWGPGEHSYHGESVYGELWLTEEEFHRNFADTSSVSGK